MALIDIHTNNLSRELRNNATYGDNWVFVPGTAINGDPDRIYEFSSLSEFQNECGTSSPEGSITYEYVAGLLSAGLPVLFKRITKYVDSSDSQKNVSATKASVAVTHSDVTDATIYAKYEGTYGNKLYVRIRNTGSAYWVDVRLGTATQLESKRLITYTATETTAEINLKLIKAIQSTEFEKIDIELADANIINTPENFSFVLTSETSDDGYVRLENGTDLDESLVADMIPSLYNELKDKILFQPKFITSGGYVKELTYNDEGEATFDTTIAEAMKELTLVRQDCRALIDLPINTPKEEQQNMAAKVEYTQVSNTEVIPSASTCAPWVYMQVGSNQLWMPPSYAYLILVASDLSKGKEVYEPKAGLSNGVIPNVIKTQFEIGSDLSEAWQSDDLVNINPIMKIQGSSYVVNGNSTLLLKDTNSEDENAFNESSADLAVIEIRRLVYKTALEIQYQYNSVDAFEKFSMRISKTLDSMKTAGALTKYDIENISTDAEPRKLKIRLDVYLTPTIKNIEIYLNVSYGSIEVTGGDE